MIWTFKKKIKTDGQTDRWTDKWMDIQTDGETKEIKELFATIIPIHKDFSPNGEQLEHRKLAHEL